MNNSDCLSLGLDVKYNGLKVQENKNAEKLDENTKMPQAMAIFEVIKTDLNEPNEKGHSPTKQENEPRNQKDI